MRKLVIIRGPQGIGKSTFLEHLGLGPYSLSRDQLRLLLRGPVLTPSGLQTDESQNERVEALLNTLLDERMERGEFVVVDGTHPVLSDFHKYKELAAKHRYQIFCVDFFAIATPELCKERNSTRPEHQRVPDFVIDRTFSRAETFTPPEGVEFVAPNEVERVILNQRIVDLTAYKRVVHIGDVQGCAEPLLAMFDSHGGLDPDTAYIFVGDYLDRGLQNAEVMKLMLGIYREKNVFCLWGNHEDHLHKLTKRLRIGSDIFKKQTLPELMKAGINLEEIDEFVDSLHDILWYEHGRHKVQVTHGGLGDVLPRPALIAAAELRKGVGYYQTLIDEEFSKRAPANWYQVHGHRNIQGLPTIASSRSFNLEDSVEFGGCLRTLVLTDSGFEAVDYQNYTYRPARERMHRDMDVVPRWIREESAGANFLSKDVVDALSSHPDIRVKVHGDVLAFNFTRSAFYNQRYDELSSKARGLFVCAKTGEVIARGYDKFFNWGEPNIPSADPEVLKGSLTFPVTAYVKENGYLGLVGVKPNGEIFCASKSSPNSDHAGWLREQLEQALTPDRLKRLARWLRDYEACMVFEVIEPERDPHIIAYDRPKLVLLDMIRRSLTFERVPYDKIKDFGKSLGLECKAHHSAHKDWDALEGFVRGVSTGGVKTRAGEVEGFCLEDANGQIVKVKSGFYALWKEARNVRDRLVTAQAKGVPFDRPLRPLKGLAPFIHWLREQPVETWKDDIITLRERYLAQRDLSREISGAAVGL